MNDCKHFKISAPVAGWSHAYFLDVCDENTNENAEILYDAPMSYITDVPMDCLDAMIRAINDSVDFCVTFDAEGWMWKILADKYDTCIIQFKDEPELIYVDGLGKYDIARSLVRDFSVDCEKWSNWLCYDDESDEEREEYKSLLKQKIATLGTILEEKPF